MIPANFPVPLTPFEALLPELRIYIESVLRAAQSRDTPWFIHMMGVPGAGKTRMSELLVKTMPRQPILLGWDQMMERIEAYKHHTDPQKAFELYEAPARDAGYVLLSGLLRRKADILFDHGASPHAHVDILNHAKTLGYRIGIVHVMAPVDVAKERIRRRTLKTGRHTPLHYVDDRLAAIAANIPDYKAVADEWVEVDNGHEGETALPPLPFGNIAWRRESP